MNFNSNKAAGKQKGMVTGAISAFLFLAMALALPAKSQETWTCEETAYYSVYEDVARTEGKSKSDIKTLKWIDENTVGIESLSLSRIDPNSETYFNQSSGSSLYINKAESPYIVVLTQPQVWMNKFGNLRVRFYRCTP
ncbi:MAG: hypothetical protein QNI90_16855 [Dinoroseobacter sp.]|nr:hypothetical protein [Dinoroseobacter sp.]